MPNLAGVALITNSVTGNRWRGVFMGCNGGTRLDVSGASHPSIHIKEYVSLPTETVPVARSVRRGRVDKDIAHSCAALIIEATHIR